MATTNISGDPNVAVSSQNGNLHSSNGSLVPFWIPSSSSARDHGSSSMGKSENTPMIDNVEGRFLQQISREDDMDEDFYEAYSMVNLSQAKKRRLTANQVRVLEKNFEVENKLYPEKKVELARALGLQPRQVAIWFQNRRARFKNKQLEKDSDSLRSDYDKLKTAYDTLLKENQSLKNQISILREKLLKQEKTKENLKNQGIWRTKPKLQFIEENLHAGGIAQANKLQEESSSTKSDVFDSESPQYGGCSSLGFEHTEKEETEEELAKSFLDSTQCLLKLEDDEYYCSSLTFQLEDQPVWPWLY